MDRLLLLFLVAGTLGCKMFDAPEQASSVKETQAPAPDTYFLMLHGGFNSCGLQEHADTELPYEVLPFDAKIGTKPEDLVAKSREGICKVDRERAKSLGEAMSGQAIAFECPLDGRANLTEPEQTVKPREPRLTPLTQGMMPQFMPLVRRLEAQGKRVEWISTCYTWADNSDDGGANLYFSWSDDPTKTYLTSRKTLWFYGSYKASRAEHSHVIGHSHGGWTSLQEVDLGFHPKLSGLYTIDPVSMRCQSLWGEACNSFPSEFGNDSIERIRRSTAVWLNFYQTKNSPAGGPQARSDNPLDAQLYPLKHTEIDNSPDVWAEIERRVNPGARTTPAESGRP